MPHLPPVARAKPAQPAGERERRLLELVDRRGSVASFARAVAELTGKTVDTEKSAYYRIIRGQDGDLVVWRLRQYATVLGVPEEDLVAPWVARLNARPASPFNWDFAISLLGYVVREIERQASDAPADLLREWAVELHRLAWTLEEVADARDADELPS